MLGDPTVPTYLPTNQPTVPTCLHAYLCSHVRGRSSLTNEKDHHYFLNRFVCVGESCVMKWCIKQVLVC